jgi:hypothetical protein
VNVGISGFAIAVRTAGLVPGTGTPTLPVGDAKAGGTSNTVPANCSRETTAFGMLCWTFDSGSTFDGRVIEPVNSDEGRPAAICSGLEWDVQPDKTTKTDKIADNANERMRTCTQDNRQ